MELQQRSAHIRATPSCLQPERASSAEGVTPGSKSSEGTQVSPPLSPASCQSAPAITVNLAEPLSPPAPAPDTPLKPIAKPSPKAVPPDSSLHRLSRSNKGTHTTTKYHEVYFKQNDPDNPTIYQAMNGPHSENYITTMKLTVAPLLKQNTCTTHERTENMHVLRGTWASFQAQAPP